MSEAIITRRGYGVDGKPQLHTETYTAIGVINWNAPKSLRGPVNVFIYGGGSAGTTGSGGGGGEMNRGDVTINPGQLVKITIGAGGIFNTTSTIGGTTSFGTYLSANGGIGSGGSGQSATQFGGGGAVSRSGGDGGIWGGGGAEYFQKQSSSSHPGNGGTYGGGGGGGCAISGRNTYGGGGGGRGGMYGGGGGGGCGWSRTWGGGSGSGGDGGEYGGNGGDGGKYWVNGYGNLAFVGKNGTDTHSWTNVDIINNQYLRGYGRGGGVSSGLCGGGGGGGGGFGGNGGSCRRRLFWDNAYNLYGDGEWSNHYVGLACGGGGGGYGSNGGDADVTNDFNAHSAFPNRYGGPGGGGGYGGDGGNDCGGGGGGFYGGYGRGGTGGCLGEELATNGTNGICIIQYYHY